MIPVVMAVSVLFMLSGHESDHRGIGPGTIKENTMPSLK
jgi:hypothetical protein